jgi:DNA polymerase V
LDTYPVEDVWGVGRKLTARLGAEGILTAADLCRADPETLRARYGVTLASTQLELQGHACATLEEEEPERQQIICSRTFGKDIAPLEDIQQAVATFAQRACEKLRARSLMAGGVWVWLNTNAFKPGASQYHPSKAFNLIAPSCDTREILAVAQGLVRAMYRGHGQYRYKKAGMGLLDLTHGDSQQADLFAQIDPRSKTLMEVMDRANAKFGRGSMGFAAAAWRPARDSVAKPTWAVKREALSPAYTTRWDQLLKAR